VPRILIIEDTPEIAEALQEHLMHQGHTAAVATRAAQAAPLIASTGPDLVILDLGLPDRDGYTVLAQLRADGYDVPVLILSARREEADKLHGFDLGADDYLTKPFSARELLARVDALLRRYTARRDAGAAGGTPAPLSDAELRARFDLTERQVSVARLLAEGLSNAEVAVRLGVTENTARNHTEHVMRKLGTSKRARVGPILRDGAP
jgi:DNA-binding response OmpR family regulator